jgi:hypothetical protein
VPIASSVARSVWLDTTAMAISTWSKTESPNRHDPITGQTPRTAKEVDVAMGKPCLKKTRSAHDYGHEVGQKTIGAVDRQGDSFR